MQIPGVEPFAKIPDLQPPRFSQGATKGFSGMLQDAIVEVENAQAGADQRVQAMIAGDGEDLHSAMLAIEKASLSFELMMQVRNKVISAYQEISRMQF